MDRAVDLERPTEILEMDPPTRGMEREMRRRQATLLDHQPGLGALLGQPRLDLSLVVRAGLHRQQQMVRRIAHLDAPRPRPAAGEDGLDRAADAQLAVDPGDPAGEPLRASYT